MNWHKNVAANEHGLSVSARAVDGAAHVRIVASAPAVVAAGVRPRRSTWAARLRSMVIGW
ncbi:hypothetical protein PP568_11775 [Mycobacteroides abscessus]|uniref:Uncharacterized protein n=1 Tax=Mycobacteroides chelonae TaxID=1774 RepID=A0AB73TYM0_MYCCH|nr:MULTISPECIES: hypothetical protein [Mycobacteroides]ARG72317.1 hypothetical protein B1T47_28970 [Mycobacterium kansasii]ETZ40923.1 hypothetical protein L839_4149 [Mycobacterium avium MAV_120809_2495]ETZ51465.1 hypothetical protein L838_2897 [Mycobacterium avium MAV_120709_2344]KRQ26102.1 hypothetical protein AOT87_08405 [Mycobacteroides sp. H003]KRQ35663.1 hypothetical protein AOT91_03795 [Mycobacteroides sp. H092]KRQ39433.1 hypothetical protein AOT92_19595 [Mycobacteroides sp. H101]KRQ53